MENNLTPVIRVQPSYEHSSKVKIAKVIARKTDRISSKSNKEILFLIYFTDPRLSSNQQVLKIVKELRGVGSAVFFGLICAIFLLSGGAITAITAITHYHQTPPNSLYDPPGLVRPADCETQLYANL